VVISVLTGARIGGLLGVIVAVPSAVVIKTALSALRPGTLTGDTNESTKPEDLTAPILSEESPRPQANNPLGVSEPTLP
jgi:hypothetical protein